MVTNTLKWHQKAPSGTGFGQDLVNSFPGPPKGSRPARGPDLRFGMMPLVRRVGRRALLSTLARGRTRASLTPLA